MKGLKNLCASWHVERKFHVQRHLYAKVSLDGGVECYWTLEDGSIVAWQAKYFCKAFDDSQYQQIDRSVKEALDSHPNLRRYVIAVPTDPSDAHVAGRMSMKERIDGYVER